MTTRERIETALEGGTPDITPYSVYPFFIDDLSDDRWQRLLGMGLGLCESVVTWSEAAEGVEHEGIDEVRDGHRYQIHRMRTPAGTVEMLRVDGWTTEHFVKEPEDYKVFQWIAENTEITPRFDVYDAQEAKTGEWGPVMHMLGRTPPMIVNVDYAGTEKFCLDYALEVPEMFELIDAMNKRFYEKVEIVAKGPGRHVRLLENLTADMLGPAWYESQLMPIYERTCRILEPAGKRLMAHYDGRLSCIKDQIARTPIHCIESLTEAPEGDMSYDECRKAWPDKAFWANISVECYHLAPEKLALAVIAKRERAGKRGFAFEISEDLQTNWEESIPVVLRALEELG
jgi:hypothetical protein